jgi:IS30 family transposase
MGNHYNQLTLDERYQIQALHELNWSARSIATKLARSNKTISRELKRLGSDYCAKNAANQAQQRRSQARKHSVLTDALWHHIDWMMSSTDYSPEQIAKRTRQERPDIAISTQSVYRWIWKKGQQYRLPRSGKAYRKRPPNGAGAHLIPERVDIDERPEIVDANVESGHWEADTVHAPDGYLVTLVERVSKLLLVAKVRHKTKDLVGKAIVRLLKPYRYLCKTITFDNGGEFAGHRKISQQLDCRCYFAKPYHSWQRGLNENTNGLFRRYLPKGSLIGSLTNKALKPWCSRSTVGQEMC